MKRAAFMAVLLCALMLFLVISAAPAFSQEETEYRKFKLENVSCDAGVIYNNTPQGLSIGVSAIATGKGAEFRKWEVTDIRLRIDDEAVRPDKTGKFFTRKESFFRVPAAVLFAAIGAMADVGGSDLERAVGKTGLALGLGLLVLQAHGDITGERSVFNLNKDLADRIGTGRSAVEITMEDKDLHLKETVKIGLIRPAVREPAKYDYGKMTSNELIGLVDNLEGQVADLEKSQEVYKYGLDPEYDEIQRKIETLQAGRGVAYRAWLDRKQPKAKIRK